MKYDSFIADFVQFEPVPAITGILPFTSSIHVLMISLCSLYDSVADSPVVPHIIMASVLFFI